MSLIISAVLKERYFLFFFFFQAEDVIRDLTVTGVQTCALPIYIERERHAVAIHEACHAVVAYRTRQHMEIDIATIEKGSDYLGMVSSIKPEDQFTRWRSEYESDILVALASLAGERMFFDSDSSSGVSGDLDSATTVASFMEGFWGMGATVSSYSTAKRLEVGAPGGGQGGRNKKGQDPEAEMRRALADRIEDNLNGLLGQVEE